MKKIKIAQIGIGHDHASAIHAELRRMTDIFEFVGYAEVPEDNIHNDWAQTNLRNSKHVYEGAKKYSADEILSMQDLDAVAIETYDLNLVKYAQSAADRGLNIHMDKAPGENAEEFEKLLKTIKQKKLAFSIGYMYRFNPLIKDAFEKARNGDFGKIHSVDAEMSCFYPKDKRDWLGLFHGGMMQYLGCHLVDLVVRLLGTPEEIIPMNCSTEYQGTTAKDFGLALFKYPNGVATIKSSMSDHGGFVRRHFLINGENRTVDIRPLERHEPGVGYAQTADYKLYDSVDWDNQGIATHSEKFGRYENMLKAFAAMVRGERDYAVDLETEAHVHRCLLTACGIACDFKKQRLLD